jgi:hypothetical protein
LISHRTFYNGGFSSDEYLIAELKIWLHNKREEQQRFTVCDYSWILDPLAKGKLFSLASRLMQSESEFQHENPLLSLLNMNMNVTIFEVHRNNLIEDTLKCINHNKGKLKREMKVVFIGEQGIDQGGVKKEFFQLMIKQLFDPNNGMFVRCQESQLMWFPPEVIQNNVLYELFGVIIGLAIYNDVILDIHFPHILYKRLLGHMATEDDLEQYDPAFASSMKYIMDNTDPNLEESLGITFSVEREVLGCIRTFELVKDGAKIGVNQSNKAKYKEEYINWLFESSCKAQFTNFKNGFFYSCDDSLLKDFEPDELELLVCGNPTLDFNQLPKNVKYEGFTANDTFIKWFWEIIFELNEEQKKKFLMFVTGCEKAPIDGLAGLGLIIQKNGNDSELLPTSHTCFNVLLIPEYSTKDKLRKKMAIALQNSEGFGLK